MEDKRFRIVGIENSLNTIPSAVNIIFADNQNNLYRGYSSGDASSTCCTYTGFERISEKATLKGLNIRLLNQCMTTYSAEQSSYDIGDVVALAIEEMPGMVYVGRIDKYLDHITTFKDEIAGRSEEKDQVLAELDCDIAFLTPIVEAARECGDLPREL